MAGKTAAPKAEPTDLVKPEEKDLQQVAHVLSHSTRQHTVGQVTALSELREIFGIQERDWSEIEPSFEVVDQETFEGIPVIIGAFRFNLSKKYTKKDPAGSGNNVPVEFVSMLLASFDPDSEQLTSPWVIVNDGGTGVRDQLSRYAEQYDGDTRLAPPLKVSKGFRRSDYPYEAEDGSVSTATTWYLG